MKYFITIFTVGLVFTLSVFSQEKNSTYKVNNGETINQIAQKFKVTPYDIYQLNPDAQNGLKPNMVLLIPKTSVKQTAVVSAKTTKSTKTINQPKIHEVALKETLFGIEKKYGISDEVLKKANPNLEKEGLKIGQTLVIPSDNGTKFTVLNQDKVVYHEVLPKETKYSIAKQYGITIAELEKRNPEIISNLPIGYKLIIKGTPSKIEKIVSTTETKRESVKSVPSKASSAIDYVNYEVKPKETLYSLSKLFGISQEELIALNPSLSSGVNVGMILTVPSTVSNGLETKKTYSTLFSKGNAGDRKKLVLLLPFNLTKIEGDTINSTSMRLKKDKFLNMTLDFYSGALMAIDSAKQIGLNIDISIFDSQETKNTSNVATLIQNNNLESSDAIIGPFYQANVEKTAGLLNQKEVPILSPLSKDLGISFTNLYQTIPSAVALREAMFDYMKAKGGVIIAVVDKKKESVRHYIQENQKEVQFAALTETGGLSTESLKSLFVKDKINFVVMETKNTSMIKWTMATMMSAMPTYKVQLVILEPNETLDTDEINFVNLTKLKLMYPSVTRENESSEAKIFEKEYRKKNKIFPSAYATRGFDLTFDTMMRLSQDKKYQETANSMATEQVDNKFEYYKNEVGGFINKGIYILNYDTDLTIKEAK